MRQSTKISGQGGEDAAARYLEGQGYKIVTRNWRPGNALRGEIDCIAWDLSSRKERVLCFVEVKTRRNAASAPQEAVTPAKQRQISKLANAFVSAYKLNDTPCRFDVVEVWLSDKEGNTAPRCVLHRGAFDYCGDF
jgi:putative endonuclease